MSKTNQISLNINCTLVVGEVCITLRNLNILVAGQNWNMIVGEIGLLGLFVKKDVNLGT